MHHLKYQDKFDIDWKAPPEDEKSWWEKKSVPKLVLTDILDSEEQGDSIPDIITLGHSGGEKY